MRETSGNIPTRPIETRTVAIRVPLRKPTLTNANEASYNPAIVVPLEPSKGRLIYYINKVTGVKRLCILAAVVKDILTIVYTIEGYMGFARYFERVLGS